MELVAGFYEVAPSEKQHVQAGHYRDPADEHRTLCGLPVVEDVKTTRTLTCTVCFTRSVLLRGGKVSVPRSPFDMRQEPD